MKNRDNVIIVVAAAILGFFFGIAFVNNWLVLNKNYPEIEMFDVPLQASVWGTVSDWVMIGVTAITAYLLWKTLYSQMRVQKSQEVQTNAVLMGHANRYPPKINFTINTEMPTNVSPSIDGGFDIYIGTYLTNSGEENIIALQVSGPFIKEVNPPIRGEIITVNTYYLQFIKFNVQHAVGTEISLYLRFNFMNSIGLKYTSEYVIRCVISADQNSTFRLNIIETETVWNPKIINFNLDTSI